MRWSATVVFAILLLTAELDYWPCLDDWLTTSDINYSRFVEYFLVAATIVLGLSFLPLVGGLPLFLSCGYSSYSSICSSS